MLFEQDSHVKGITVAAWRLVKQQVANGQFLQLYNSMSCITLLDAVLNATGGLAMLTC